MLLNATALLAVIGLLIALLWAWVWSGVFASSRRVAMRMDMRGGSASAELNRVVWPLMPLLSLVWFVTADLVGREAVGADTMGRARCSWACSALWLSSRFSPCTWGTARVGIPGVDGTSLLTVANPGARERELARAR